MIVIVVLWTASVLLAYGLGHTVGSTNNKETK